MQGIGSRVTYALASKDISTAMVLFEYSIALAVGLITAWAIKDFIRRVKK